MSSGGRNRDRQNFWDSQAQQQNAAITQVDPLEQAYRDRQQAVLNWENTPGHDIRDMPGMSDAIQIGNAALARANQQRQSGSIHLADPGSSGYAQQLHELQQNQLGQEVGTGLENARAAIHAEATGSVLPLSQMNLARRSAQLNNSTQMFSQWNQRKSKNWWDYLTDTVGMLHEAVNRP